MSNLKLSPSTCWSDAVGAGIQSRIPMAATYTGSEIIHKVKGMNNDDSWGINARPNARAAALYYSSKSESNIK